MSKTISIAGTPRSTDDDHDEWPPPFEHASTMPRPLPVDVLAALIDFARKTWRNDGAEGETVHKLCDEIELRERQNPTELRDFPPTIPVNLERFHHLKGFLYTWGIDHSRTRADGTRVDDVSAVMVIERLASGERRIVGLSFIDRMMPPVNEVHAMQHYSLTKGWQCACGLFSGEERITQDHCRGCEAKRPG